MTEISSKQLWETVSGPVVVSMTNDYLFKALLQSNAEVLKNLVCSLLRLPLSSVKDLQILNPIVLGESIDEKTVMMDVLVLLENGTRLNLEMQVYRDEDWIARSLYYSARNIAQLKRGQDYSGLKPVIHIGFLDYTLFKNKPVFYETYRFMSTKTGRLYTDLMQIGTVDLSRTDLADEEDRKYNTDKWARLFKAKTWEEIRMLAEKDTIFDDAAVTIRRLTEDEKIRMQCEAREDYWRREHGVRSRLRDEKRKNARLEKKLAEKDEEIARLRAALEEKG